MAISSGPIELGRDETVLQASFSRVSTSWVATAVGRHGVCIRRVASESRRPPAAVRQVCPGMAPVQQGRSARYVREARTFCQREYGCHIVNPRWPGHAGAVWPRADRDPSRRVGDLQQGQGRFVVRQILGDDR